MATVKKKLKRKTLFDYVDIIILLILGFITFYPFWNILMISFNDPTDTLQGGITLYVRKFTIENYQYFFRNDSFINAFWVSVSRTVIGSLSSVIFTAAFAYGMSKKWLLGQKFFLVLMIIPMYISGGMIPTFLLIRDLGLYQNFLVYIIPCLLSTYNVIIMMTSFRAIPPELEESVRIDGGNDLVIFFRIIIPVSMPMMATIILFNAVGQWNSWMDTMIYGDRKMMTLQMKLVELLKDADQVRKLMQSGNATAAQILSKNYKPNVESLKATAMAITAVPIVLIYPFLQKYFVKGVMIGSLKG